ncbi:MAG: DMT family transporter [Thermoplasmataceae archaeon]|jgi:drug/metabolite transporter (DMT)-like permease|nr:DMT family transporter [Candidatus Thermoplasmatota archaeon]
MNNQKMLYMGLILLVTFFWGVTFPLIKIALEYISPVVFLALRFSVSAIMLVPFILKSRRLLERRIARIGITAGIFLFLGYYFQTVGLEYTTAANSGIITGIYVVLLPFISFAYLKIRASKLDVVASALAFAGLFIMSASSLALKNSTVDLGDILTVICGVAYAVQIAYVSKYSGGLDSTVFTFYQILTVAVLSAVFIPTYSTALLTLNTMVVFVIVFTALFGGVLAYFITTKALIYVEPTSAGIIFVGEPIFAAISAVIIGGEVLGPLTIVGGSVMVFAMLLTSVDKYLSHRRALTVSG